MKNSVFVILYLILLLGMQNMSAQTTSVLPVDKQTNFAQLHKFIYQTSAEHYHSTSSTFNTGMYAQYGEFSILLSDDGNIIYPDTVPQKYENLEINELDDYSLTAKNHLSIGYTSIPKKVAIFKSKTGSGNNAISWQALHFQYLLDNILPKDNYTTIDEDSFTADEISDSTEIIIFPSVKIDGQDYEYYVEQIVNQIPSFETKIQAFISKGGKIYTEGNGVLFLEKAGLIAEGSVDYSNILPHDGNSFYSVTGYSGSHPVSIASKVCELKLYSNAIPTVSATNIKPLITISENSTPAIFTVTDDNAKYADQIIVNLGLTSTLSDGEEKSQQLYTMQSILSFFASSLDITRNIRNTFTGEVIAGENAIAYDVIDTFTVNIQVRNLSNKALNDITITEEINPYFRFYEMVNGDAKINGQTLTFSNISLSANEELTLSYSLLTPLVGSPAHEKVDDYLDTYNFISVSENISTYKAENGLHSNAKNMAYADILFSANIVADADVNWKNFLGLEYQPFKVFLNLENKGRTQAENVVYTQYIPKDVPYYQSDKSINIPILKTPGGKFVTVMRGSDDENNPEYDFDSDGKPDAWLDTASIYPKGYTITEELVYWSNPWAYLRSGNPDEFVFEDIDGDGAVALDTDGDGIVDVEEPGDQIRVWKVTWDIETVKGYGYFEPYCYYELWLDPPKLVELAAGVGYANDSLDEAYKGMYYPFTPDINSADLTDKRWENWMEMDENGEVIWKEMVLQSVNNYEGYTFVDTASTHFKLQPSDKVIGRTPQPHNEFIAVVSLGGEEIDMTHWTPRKSLYSNVDYTTIFNEEKRTPIRTTYTYYAPLPNPLQFEYLSDSYTIYDTLDNKIDKLPHRGKAKLQFNIDASTEYSYYWIRGVGHDVDYNDPSEAIEGPEFEGQGDGVFGYFVYEIPKGMGGYSIKLPRRDDGTFATEEIVQVDGAPFKKWLDNPNTKNEVEVWEGPLSYQIYIPQVLIPPALDDDNHDGIDDWIDDRGDRFSSKTGFLHDHMIDDGEDWIDYPETTHWDNLSGDVDSGWYYGADKTYGDDVFEKLGVTEFTINAEYIGKGREGNLEISKGGTLVVEEIFGGSPWVIFSHVLSSKVEGLDLEIESTVDASVVKVGVDTLYLKHTIKDSNEPHAFDMQFDPYHVSAGYDDANFTTLVGAKDPCNLMEPAIKMPAILDPSTEQSSVTLIPLAESIGSDELKGYPKNVSGSFIELRIEASNGSDNNWKNVKIDAFPSGLGSSEIIMQYVAYPRPLVPDDDFGTFATGWRFNQPEGEVIVQLGNEIPMIQPTRRAYFVYLLKVEESLENGIYEVPFTISGEKVYYTGESRGSLSYEIPSAQFCIVDKDENGKVKDFENLVLGQITLQNLAVTTTSNFSSLEEAKWSVSDINADDYKTEGTELPITAEDGNEVIDLSSIGEFPQTGNNEFVILQPGVVDSYNSEETTLRLTEKQFLNFKINDTDNTISSKAIKVTPIGPKVKVSHILYSINETPVTEGIVYESDKPIYATTKLIARNEGADISRNTKIEVHAGPYFEVVADQLPENATYSNNRITVDFGDMILGAEKEVSLTYLLKVNIPKTVDITQLINQVDIDYTGTAIEADFNFSDNNEIIASLYDFEIKEITYSQSTDNTISIRATAFNRGITAENVWFRIYPVIGEGAYEFAISEESIETFEAGEEFILEAEYTYPNIGKSLEMLARIDDQDSFIETTEQNNIEKTNFIITDIEDINSLEGSFTASPTPCTDVLNFDYSVINSLDNISISIYNANGVLVKELNDCPSTAGVHKIVLTNLDFPSGSYIYTVSSEGKQLFNGNIIVK